MSDDITGFRPPGATEECLAARTERRRAEAALRDERLHA
jgi:hypothetical protein